MTWKADAPDEILRFGPLGWLRVCVKGVLVGTVTFGCLGLLLLVRLVERPIFGNARPWTPHITQFVCRTALAIIGIRRNRTGRVMTGQGAMVSNHVSWLDIFILNAEARIYFVAKSEVRGWPGIGWLAQATGTLFIKRDPAEARRQVAVIADRLRAGHMLLFFPEGTSTDGRRVLSFRSSLFQPFVSEPDGLALQPVTIAYHAPAGSEDRFYGWWGDMGFGPNLLKMLGARRHGHVDIVFHEPLDVASSRGRKDLAMMSEQTVAAELKQRLGGDDLG